MENIFKLSYFTDDHFRGFDRYKYRSIDTNPIAIYVMHPIWNFTVEYFPMWFAPNLMTFFGWLLTLSNFLLFSYYDWDLSANGLADPSVRLSFIPSWVWLYCAVSQFVSYALDCMDGKQARRTGSSSPLGEMFDHGLDSSACWLMAVSAFSVPGIGVAGTTQWDFFYLCMSIMVVFYLSHWEKYNTSVLYLPWLYDISQLFLVGLFLAVYVLTPNAIKFNAYGSLPATNAVLLGIHCCLIFVAFPVSCYNIYKVRCVHPEWCLSKLEGMAPLMPIAMSLLLFHTWAWISPSDILRLQPRLFVYAFGIIYSNVNCRLIVAQMTATKCERANSLLFPFVVLMALALSGVIAETTALYIFSVGATIAHLHYGICIVNSLCDHLGIRCFKVSKPSEVVQNGTSKLQ